MLEYKHPVREDDDIFTLEEFDEECQSGMLTDYDGFAWPVKDGFYAMPSNLSDWIYPSNRHTTIPEEATHILWANK